MPAKTLDEVREQDFAAMQDGRMTRWDVAVHLAQCLIAREIMFWIERGHAFPLGTEECRQNADVFFVLGKLMNQLPRNGKDLHRAAAEIEN